MIGISTQNVLWLSEKMVGKADTSKRTIFCRFPPRLFICNGSCFQDSATIFFNLRMVRIDQSLKCLGNFENMSYGRDIKHY